MQTQTHTVKRGENLSTIARQYQLPGWSAIYYATENAAFRRAHPDPDRIPVGARLQIPMSLSGRRRALETRIRRLEQAKREAATLFAEQERAMSGDYASARRMGDAVDTGATLATILVNLTQLTMKAHKIMQLSDEAAEAATKTFAKDTLKAKAKQARDLGALVVKESRSSSANPVWLATRAVATAWCDMTSPSFWASAYVNLANGKSWSEAVTTSPRDIHQRAVASLQRTSAQIQADLNAKIAEARRELQAVR